MIARLARDKFLRCLDRLEVGQLTLTLPGGAGYAFAGSRPGPSANMHIHDWSVLTNLARGGDTAFARDYADGKWHVDQLQNLITLALRNEAAVKRYIFGGRLVSLMNNLAYKFRVNSLRGSRRNIQAHYDLGNDFYQLWLDPSMTYSSGLFYRDTESLTDAQHNKYDRIIDSFDLRSGRTLEIGCGWGGYAERAVSRGDFSIKGITLSEKQRVYADERLNGNAQIALEDYRTQSGQYDQIVSIEMFEAVGEKYWKTYFAKVADLLKSHGKALIQTISIDEKLFDSYRTGQDFVRSFIFPGGMLPSASRFIREAADAGLRVNNHLSFGQDYAQTLEQWLKAFDEQKPGVLALGYDEKFVRLWRFYLATCAAGFRTGRTNVHQFELQHAP